MLYLKLAIFLVLMTVAAVMAESGDIFDVNDYAVVSEADLIYLSPSKSGDDLYPGSLYPAREGQPIGNGRMGTSVRADGSQLQFQINRNDVFGVNKDHLPISNLTNNPLYFGGCGWVSIDVGSQAFVSSADFEHRLSVYRAESVVRGTNVTARCSVLTDQDILLIEIDDNRYQPLPITLTLSTWLQPASQYGSHQTITQFIVEAEGFRVLRHSYSEGQFHCSSDLAVGASGETFVLQQQDAQARVLQLPAKAGKRLLQISSSASDGVASELLRGTSGKTYDELTSNTRQWWADFWNRTFVKLHSADGVADYLQRVRTLAIYYVATTSRGDFPTKFNGMLFSAEGAISGWGPQYWVWNTESYYYPTFAADCSELTDPWFAMFNRNLSSYERAAKQLWGVDEGIFIPETSNFDGCVDLSVQTAANMCDVLAQRMPAANLPAGTANDLRFEAILRFYTDTPADHWAYKLSNGRYYWATHILSSAGEIATQAWWRYRYTGDNDFLMNQGYPLIKGVADFYLHYCKKEADGLYHVPLSNAHESYWGVRDGLWDLAAIRSVVPMAVLASNILGVDAAKRPQWQDLLDHLASYPQVSDPQAKALLAGTALADSSVFPDNAWAPGLLVPGQGISGNKNFESVWTAPMFPFDDWSLVRDNTADKNTATATYMGHVLRDYVVEQGLIGSVHDRIAILAARIGLADDVAGALPVYVGGQSEAMPNGMTPGIAANEVSAEHLGNTAMALQEALMQSQAPYSGDQEVIYLAPAWPAAWDADFRLLARGGFMVSARIRTGTVQFAQIFSRQGGMLRMVNPWPTGCMVQIGEASPSVVSGARIEMAAQAGKKYTFWKSGESFPGLCSITAPPTTDPMRIEFSEGGRQLRLGREREHAFKFLVTEWNNGKVSQYGPFGPSADGNSVQGVPNPTGVAEGNGSIYAASLTGNFVGKYSSVNWASKGSMIQTVYGSGCGPQGVAYENGRVYVALYNTGRLIAFVPDNGQEDGNPDTPSAHSYASVAYPMAVTSAVPNGEPAGTVYYTTATSNGSGVLGKWKPGSSPVTLATFSSGSGARGVIAYGGNVYVALYSTNKIVRYSTSNQQVTDFITGLSGPYGLAVAADNLYVAQHNNSWIRAFDLDTKLPKYSFALSYKPVFITIRPAVCTEPIEGDLTGDCKVDISDLIIMLANWLNCNIEPQSLCWE
jgi:hypothetical protein